MTTLTIQVEDSIILNKITNFLSKFKNIKIEEKKEYSEEWKSLITALKDLDKYKKWELEFEDAEDFLKTL